MKTWRTTWQLLKAHGLTLLGIVLVVYAPYHLILNGLRVSFSLDYETAERMASLLAVLMLPIGNAALILALDRGGSGQPAGVVASLRGSLRCWRRLLVAYISVGLVFIGFLALGCLPGAIVMMLFGLKNPLVLLPFGLPALYVMTRYVYLDCVVVLEGLSPWEGRQRTSTLAKEGRIKIALIALLTMGPPNLLEIGVSFVRGEEAGPAGAALPTILGLLSAVLYIVPTVFFYARYRELLGSPKPESSEALPLAQVIELRRPASPS